MKMITARNCWAAFVAVGFALAANASTLNYALNRPVAVSSTYQTYDGSNAVDAVVSDASRWLGSPAGSNWIEINFTTNVTLAQAHIYTGYQTQSGSWITNIQLQAWSGSAWTNIPGGAITNTHSFAFALTFNAPVTTTKLRFYTADTTYARLRDITLWDQSQPLYTGVTGDYVPGTPLLGAPVLVNQIGYQVGAPKRFTAPTVTNGAPFSITTTNSTNALFSGSISDGRADFSAFEPADAGPYVIRVSGATNGISYPFLILSNLVSAKYTVPAVQFMLDSRSGVGTHKSAFGGCPWRDGTYYSFEIPSLIYLLLNDRVTVESLPREIDYAAEKAAVLGANFPFITTTEDAGFLDALRRYYTNQPPPLTTKVPDVVQAIHFGLGVTLERPSTRDWSGDERPRQIHAQTVEWCAYFLHAWPVLRNWLDDGFYRNVRDFAFAQWSVSSGMTNASVADDDPSSLEIDPLWAPATYGTVDKHPYKGRHAPGHSILPNLLMYQVALREGRGDATNYLKAARTQAQWIIDTLDWADPRTTKGQRMSEHKMMPGLVYFATQFPGDAPPGLTGKIQSWADTMLARSDNLWDFRMYETNDFDGNGLVDWSLPKFSQNWNEPGNLAGFPACALAAKQIVTNNATRQRLTEVAWATMDCLFGRNPLNACSASRLSLGFPDAEAGWTPVYSGSAGYLDFCRGALASGPATEHYPYNPSGTKRHNEGWVNFNAAWNVGLAHMLADLKAQANTLEVHLPIIISEILPAPAGDPLAEYIELWNPTPYPARLSGLTLGGGVRFTFPTNTFTELPPGDVCLLVRDVTAFTNQFGAGLPVVGTFTGELADAGETLSLGDVNGSIFTSFTYVHSNLVAGYSLRFVGAETNFPNGPWQRSPLFGGSPGTMELVQNIDPTSDANVQPYADTPVSGYMLNWSDEFNGAAVDTNKWDFRTGVRFWSVQLAANNSVSNGLYLLHVKKETVGTNEYTAGGIISKALHRYGYYETRMRVPPGQGWHTSFWMMRNNSPPEKPVSIELDALENDSVSLLKYAVNIHRHKPTPHATFGTRTVNTPSLNADFHVIGCEFTPTQVRYFFDGTVVQTLDATQFPHNDMNIWLTSVAAPLGGTSSVDDTLLPNVAEYDYVRYFVPGPSAKISITNPKAGGVMLADTNTWLRLEASAVSGDTNYTAALEWSKVAGPGEVTFTDATNASTAARFAAKGNYTLQCQAVAGLSTAHATVNVSIAAPVSGALRQGVDNYSHTASFVRGDSPDWNSGGRDQMIVGRWGGQPLRAVFSFDLSPLAPEALFEAVSLDLWTDDTLGTGNVGELELRLLEATPVEGTGDGSSDGNGTGTGVTWLSRTGGTNGFDLWANPGGDFGTDILSAVPGYDATLPNHQKTLSSSPAFVAAVQWAFDSAQPLNLMLISPETEGGTNNFISRLSSDDNGEVENRPRLRFTFWGNFAPGVSTGVAPPVMAGLPATMAGAVSNAAIAVWSKVSGPGEVTFGSPGQAATTVTFSMDGRHVLRLSASNALAQTFCDVPVTVLPFTRPVISAMSVSGVQGALEINGAAGWNYLVQASTNLTSWTTLFTTNAAVLPFGWVDGEATNLRARFYRVQMLP